MEDMEDKGYHTQNLWFYFRCAGGVLVWAGCSDTLPCEEFVRIATEDNLAHGDINYRVSKMHFDKWSSRLWAYQEALFNACTFIYLGSFLIPVRRRPWQTHSQILTMPNGEQKFLGRPTDADTGILSDESLSSILFSIDRVYLDRLHLWKPDELLHNIYRSRLRQCSYIKDKLYGIVGVLSWGRKVNPDYQLSVNDVLASVWCVASDNGEVGLLTIPRISLNDENRLIPTFESLFSLTNDSLVRYSAAKAFKDLHVEELGRTDLWDARTGQFMCVLYDAVEKLNFVSFQLVDGFEISDGALLAWPYIFDADGRRCGIIVQALAYAHGYCHIGTWVELERLCVKSVNMESEFKKGIVRLFNIEKLRTEPIPQELIERKGLLPTLLEYNFLAISHCWGTTETIRSKWTEWDIPCNYHGLQKFDEIINVARALKYKWLWIDVLCVEQTNVEDKNYQVKLMGDYYRCAGAVLIWSGCSKSPSCNVCVYTAGSDNRYEIAKWYLTEYCSRVWTYQEGLLNAHTLIYIGGLVLPVARRPSETLLQNVIMDNGKLLSIGVGEESNNDIQLLHLLSSIENLFRDRISFWKSDELLNGVYQSRFRVCSYVQDKLFGIFSMVSWGRSVKCDYDSKFDDSLAVTWQNASKNGELGLMTTPRDSPNNYNRLIPTFETLFDSQNDSLSLVRYSLAKAITDADRQKLWKADTQAFMCILYDVGENVQSESVKCSLTHAITKGSFLAWPYVFNENGRRCGMVVKLESTSKYSHIGTWVETGIMMDAKETAIISIE
ncbi:hypothetical protein HK098_000122 [Nowakowskiella sp. JEL0407]|nr:hypothetical protein HK098_000122 [Nowakowskiella sp. JEL0407]